MENAVREFKCTQQDTEFRVFFAPAALHELKRDVIRGYKSIPRRGAEVGGLLQGAIIREDGEIRVRIDRIVPVGIEYRYGPSWRLSERDHEIFHKALRDAEGEVIGWYRSHTRVGDQIEEDRSCTARFFPSGLTAFLICYPDVKCNIAATLRAWTAGADESVLTFDAGHFSVLDEALQSAEADDEAAIVPGISLPKPRPAWHSLYMRGALIGLMSLLMIVAVGFFLRDRVEYKSASAATASTSPPRRPAGPPVAVGAAGLGMKIEKQGNALFVSWNRDSPQIQQATDGSITIGEGNRTRILQLSAHELYTGGLLYTPGGKDVRMDLEVRGPSGNFGQSIRVVGSDSLPDDRNTAASTRSAPVPVEVAPAPRTAPEYIPPPPRRPETQAPLTQTAELKTPDPKPVEPKNIEPKALDPKEKQTLADASAEVPEPPPNVRTESVAVPQQPAPPLHSEAAPEPALRESAGSREAPAPRPPAASQQYVPPRAIQSVQPSMRHNGYAIPGSAFSQSSASQEIDVDVTIDVHGNVSRVNVNKANGAAAYLLAASARDAAWSWRFAPATLGGKPVESHMTLKFVFTKNQR